MTTILQQHKGMRLPHHQRVSLSQQIVELRVLIGGDRASLLERDQFIVCADMVPRLRPSRSKLITSSRESLRH